MNDLDENAPQGDDTVQFTDRRTVGSMALALVAFVVALGMLLYFQENSFIDACLKVANAETCAPGFTARNGEAQVAPASTEAAVEALVTPLASRGAVMLGLLAAITAFFVVVMLLIFVPAKLLDGVIRMERKDVRASATGVLALFFVVFGCVFYLAWEGIPSASEKALAYNVAAKADREREVAEIARNEAVRKADEANEWRSKLVKAVEDLEKRHLSLLLQYGYFMQARGTMKVNCTEDGGSDSSARSFYVRVNEDSDSLSRANFPIPFERLRENTQQELQVRLRRDQRGHRDMMRLSFNINRAPGDEMPGRAEVEIEAEIHPEEVRRYCEDDGVNALFSRPRRG